MIIHAHAHEDERMDVKCQVLPGVSNGNKRPLAEVSITLGSSNISLTCESVAFLVILSEAIEAAAIKLEKELIGFNRKPKRESHQCSMECLGGDCK